MAYLKLISLMALSLIKSTAISTPIQPSLNTTAVVAITPPHLPLSTSLNRNLSGILTAHGLPICTQDRRWQLPGDAGAGIYASACYMAVREMENNEFISPTPLRFLAATARGRYTDSTVRTPRRYIYDRKTKFQTIKADRVIS